MQLNFQKFNFQVKTDNNGHNLIWDVVRKKYITLTPEEWVRQHCIMQLISNQFPAGRLSVERTFPNSTKRYDIAYLDMLGKPTLLVECKAPSIKINEKTLTQVTGYIALLNVPYVLLTNGITHFFIYRNANTIQIAKEFPRFSQISH